MLLTNLVLLTLIALTVLATGAFMAHRLRSVAHDARVREQRRAAALLTEVEAIAAQARARRAPAPAAPSPTVTPDPTHDPTPGPTPESAHAPAPDPLDDALRAYFVSTGRPPEGPTPGGKPVNDVR